MRVHATQWGMAALISAGLIACSSDDSGEEGAPTTGGSPSAGGSTGVGGTLSTGGAVAGGGLGGQPAAGAAGDPSTGGQPPTGSGGSVPASGGSLATGGEPATGGSPGTGGAPPTGDECSSNDECRTTLYPHLAAQYGTLLDCEPYQGDMVCICDATPCRDFAAPTCSDGIQNQGETGVDCGGPCAACPPSCSDGILNQDETDVDCGGVCSGCGSGKQCNSGADCVSGECTGGVCVGGPTGWRWAHSGDGNQHDPDDWHASAMALALMHRADLKDKLVHFDYNNHLGDNSTQMEGRHRYHVETARDTFGYNPSVFWDCQVDLNGAVNSLAAAINASSADSRLMLTCAGPMEVCWRGIDAADDDKEQFVTVISHSGWNDDHDDTSEMNHQWSDIANDFDVVAHHINDQNPPAFRSDCSDWQWLSQIPGYGATLLDLMCDDSAAGDASDAGMVYYLIVNDGNVSGTSGNISPSMSDVQSFFGI